MKKALVFVFLFGIVPMTALAAQPLEPPVTIEPITRTLTVTISGLGTVTSNPAGINCTNGEGECSHAFQIDRSVALLATAPPSDESRKLLLPGVERTLQPGRLQPPPWS